MLPPDHVRIHGVLRDLDDRVMQPRAYDRGRSVIVVNVIIRTYDDLRRHAQVCIAHVFRLGRRIVDQTRYVRIEGYRTGRPALVHGGVMIAQ